MSIDNNPSISLNKILRHKKKDKERKIVLIKKMIKKYLTKLI